MAITYPLGSKLYINLTNQCNNDCKFCVRKFKDGLGGYKLWLDKEPSVQEVINDLENPEDYKEIVFCGFGEPLMRLNAVKKVAAWLKDNYPEIPLRINTNGLANLVYQRNILPELEELIATMSISLNASTAEQYQEVAQSKYGRKAFEAVIDFIKEAKKYISEVQVSVVTYPGVDVEKCKKIATDLDVKFKIREF
ncbi:TatD family nuclease-associated radical SAM protein [Halanaerobacter jeridensis]|uniref:TatD family-associated radical SAM protein n=1 Tax=Halanaerobacter jeridensis TaxID=706427 RepID=A0A939BPS4_9FIRM|nr:TatD family nuclease-associated radical SAM protein [Halanaerobacter jeridensis]MBM7557228.1 TatD family-associated radical SAM protein [Halanaerobacter jeridensis]